MGRKYGAGVPRGEARLNETSSAPGKTSNRLTPQMILLLLGTAFLFALRFLHLYADFPAYHFYSQDRARFTDEGFYSSAALHFYTLGRTYIPGGWNPGVFMPVWPLIVGGLFHFTGISVAAARSLAVTCTAVGAMLAYAVTRQYRSSGFACITVLLIAANALGFFYGRLALLEPAQVMFLLLAIYLAGKVKPKDYFLSAVVGLVCVLTVLTKTTASFLLPAALYPMWAGNRTNPRDAWKLLAVAIGVLFLLLGAVNWIWYLRYQSDANIILHVRMLWQLENAPLRLLRFFFRGTWIDPVLFPLALLAIAAAAFKSRFFWRDTLFTTAFLWFAGYAAFIAFHYDGPPRYFVTLIVPTIWFALIFIEWLWSQHRPFGQAAALCIALSTAANLAAIAYALAHPHTTLRDAAVQIKNVVLTQSEPGSSQVLIGRGADQISLLSGGLRTMDSDGHMPLAQKLDVYQPEWFMTWTSDPLERREIVARNRRMLLRAEFPGLDPDRNAGIILYQLFPPGKN